MAAIRCPWCEERLEAADGDILSAALTMHFHRRHGLDLPDPERVTGGRESHLSSLFELGETGEAEGRGGSPAYGGRLTQRGGDLYGTSGPPRTIGVRRFDDQQSVECPLCGMEVQGEDEDSLSQNLKEHMSTLHELPGDE